MKRQVSDVLWVVGGTSTTALGTLVGVRFLTQFMQPSSYGVLALVLGVSTLIVSLVATPLTQAAIHFYPGVADAGSPRQIVLSLFRGLRRMLPWIAAAIVVSAAVCLWRGEGLLVASLATMLVASDCWRSANLSLLNAARRHQRYVLWTFTDTWGRPLVGAAAALAFGPSPVIVLGAYVGVSGILLWFFSRRMWPEERQKAAGSVQQSETLDGRMWSYALPLVPLGLISWASNLGDRYIIAGTLGIADAGVYAAVYGLASAPFMLAGGTVELLLRPVHQAAVASGNHARARSVLRAWLAIVTVVGAIGVTILALGHQLIAYVCVGQAYRHASGLMPWIGLGYAIRATSYVLERVCYAYGRTGRVLQAQLFAAAATIVATPLGVLTAGLKGAAMAVSIYFSIQLIVAARLARRTLLDASTDSMSKGQVNDPITAKRTDAQASVVG